MKERRRRNDYRWGERETFFTLPKLTTKKETLKREKEKEKEEWFYQVENQSAFLSYFPSVWTHKTVFKREKRERDSKDNRQFPVSHVFLSPWCDLSCPSTNLFLIFFFVVRCLISRMKNLDDRETRSWSQFFLDVLSFSLRGELGSCLSLCLPFIRSSSPFLTNDM